MVLLFYFVDPTKSQKRGVVMETPDKNSKMFGYSSRAGTNHAFTVFKVRRLLKYLWALQQSTSA